MTIAEQQPPMGAPWVRVSFAESNEGLIWTRYAGRLWCGQAVIAFDPDDDLAADAVAERIEGLFVGLSVKWETQRDMELAFEVPASDDRLDTAISVFVTSAPPESAAGVINGAQGQPIYRLSA